MISIVSTLVSVATLAAGTVAAEPSSADAGSLHPFTTGSTAVNPTSARASSTTAGLVASITVAASRLDCTGPSGAPPPSVSTSGGFVGRIPERIADTRSTGSVPAGCWVRVGLPTSVPGDASAVALTVTSDRAVRPGYLTVHPCGRGLPEFSNVNVRPEGPTSNFAIVEVDATREVCVFSSGGTDVIVDLVGHVGPGGSTFHEDEPRRVLDTREASLRPSTVDSPVAPRQVVRVDRSRLGVPVGATAVLVNLTVTRATGPGFLTAYPCTDARPATSNVNYDRGADRANTSIVALASSGGAEAAFCVELEPAAADVIVDVVGWLGGPDGLEFRAGTTRLADSRDGTGGWSGPGWGGPAPFEAGETRSIRPDTAVAFPDGTRVAVLGVLSTRAEQPGFLQARPCGNTAEVSSLNFVTGVDIANFVAVPLADDGTVCITASARTDVVVDLVGGFAADGAMRSLVLSGPEVFPAFRPDIHDYAAVCDAATGNAFTVAARGMPGTRVDLVGGPSGTPRLSTGAVRDADQALTLRVVPESAPATGPVAEYWIRCLPPDFPRMRVDRPGDPVPGWYLLNNGSTTANFSIIVDTNGVPVWYRRGIPGREPRGLQRLADGSVSFFQSAGFAFGIAPENRFERRTLAGDLIAEYGVSGGDATNHHELLPLENGNFLTISMRLEDVPVDGDPVACSSPSGAGVIATKVAGARIEELDPQGNPVAGGFAWDADVLGTLGRPDAARIPLEETTVRLCFSPDPGQNGPNWYLSAVHPNALAERGSQILVSARHADAVYAIDRTTGEIEWKLGGLDRPGVSLEIDGLTPRRPYRQHDVRVRPDGNVTLFDNRTRFPFPIGDGVVSGPARFVEYLIDESAGANGRATVVRQIARANGDDSGALGSARVQPDGGVVINWGAVPGPTFTEYGPGGDVLMEVYFFGPRFSYRTVKEPLGAFDVAELRATAGR